MFASQVGDRNRAYAGLFTSYFLWRTTFPVERRVQYPSSLLSGRCISARWFPRRRKSSSSEQQLMELPTKRFISPPPRPDKARTVIPPFLGLFAKVPLPSLSDGNPLPFRGRRSLRVGGFFKRLVRPLPLCVFASPESREPLFLLNRIPSLTPRWLFSRLKFLRRSTRLA